MTLKMPLRELMRNFFDELKSISSGFASISYSVGEMREADVVRMAIQYIASVANMLNLLETDF